MGASGWWQGEGADAVATQRISQEEVQRVLGDVPPPPAPDDKELESAYWFHRSVVAAALQGNPTFCPLTPPIYDQWHSLY